MAGETDVGLSDEAMEFLVTKFQQSFGMVLTAAFESTRDSDACTPEQADDVSRAAVIALCLTLIVQCEISRRPELDLTTCVMDIVSDTLERHREQIQQRIKDLNEGVGESFH